MRGQSVGGMGFCSRAEGGFKRRLSREWYLWHETRHLSHVSYGVTKGVMCHSLVRGFFGDVQTGANWKWHNWLWWQELEQTRPKPVKKRHPFELAARRRAIKAKERLEMRDPKSLSADRAAAQDKEEWDRQEAEWVEQEKLWRQQIRERWRRPPSSFIARGNV